MNTRQTRDQFQQAGFSYVEVMIALIILMIGILGLTSALSANMIRSFESEKKIVAKQSALSAIESIISARDIHRPGAVAGWDTVGNVGTNPVSGVPRGIFLPDFCPIREELGWDGVAGTADDACAGTGACNAGQASNTSPVIEGMQRKIVITDIEDPDRPTPPHAIARRRIDVTIRYNVNQITRDEMVSTIVTNY